MSNLSSVARTAIVGAILLIAIVGGALLIAGRGPVSPAVQSTGPSPLPSGITGWKSYTSSVYGLTLGYPANWSVKTPATRKWQAGDAFPADQLPYADTFVSPGQRDVQIGLIVWAIPVEKGVAYDSVESLKAWAVTFCKDVHASSSCDDYTQQAMEMCANETGDCKPAILVPTATAQYAFVPNWDTLQFFGNEYAVIRIVAVAREDGFAPAARYGGSLALLKSVLTTMHVWGPS